MHGEASIYGAEPKITGDVLRCLVRTKFLSVRSSYSLKIGLEDRLSRRNTRLDSRHNLAVERSIRSLRELRS